MQKEGYKTTEFWLTILSNLSAVIGALSGVIKPETAAIIIAAINAVYGFIRAITKSSVSTGNQGNMVNGQTSGTK